jgi:NitT/TauT family transport system permease protein
MCSKQLGSLPPVNLRDMATREELSLSLTRAPVKFVRSLAWIDVLLFAGISFVVYALLGVAQEWGGPYRPKSEIDLGLGSLLRYSFFSLVRVFAAYFLSLVFTFTYGYWAAKSRRAEPILISLLDILQSVPVLGFMPGVVLALVNVFPRSNLGLELATVLMVFTCEGWNMVFSFYSSIKSIPQELVDVSEVFRLRQWDRLKKIELPYAMNGLLWNSMLSMAGGWFYLMVMESFTLGDKDFRLPGIGSYMAVAYERSNSRAIIAGIVVMFVLIIIVDRCLWAPLVAWSDRFRYDRENLSPVPRSLVLDWIRRSRFLALYYRWVEAFRKKWDTEQEAFWEKRPRLAVSPAVVWQRIWGVLRILLGALGILVFYWGVRGVIHLLAATTIHDWLIHLRDTFFTFLRVTAATVVGSVWTIPLGVFIGTQPKWTRRFQPVVQVVASFPAPMVFPLITWVLIRAGVSFQFGAVVLMLFASQWYILFNVISGATLIPHQMLDVAQIFRVRGFEYWRAIILPAIFPSLVNGWITAAGGAWNSCIVSEYVLYGSRELTATGIGATITDATQRADFPRLAGATITMIATVVLLNRFFWGGLYRLAETKYKLEN